MQLSIERLPKALQLKAEDQQYKMCIAAFLWQSHSLYPLLLLLNRDEYHSRPTKPLGWWEGGEIVGGKDEVAGGTWFASNKYGKVAFLTNFREVETLPTKAKSRGDLPVGFLKSAKSPMEFAEAIMDKGREYNGFNLVLADLCSKAMVYVTNRPKDTLAILEVPPGIHVLSNANLDTPWLKSLRLRHSFEELLEKYGEKEVPIKEMMENLMKNTVKDQESQLPCIYPPELEYHLSSIFIDINTPLGRYGTRSISALSMTSSGQISMYENYLDKDSWIDQVIVYQVDRMN